MEKKYFYCYSTNMKKFFCDNGLRYITKSVHDKTKRTFWVFESSDRVTELLNKWREDKLSK